jgi:UDP-2,3-diacylglucosamine hydrolase
MHSIFVSDLHLAPGRPQACRAFFDFVRGPAAQAAALYILGDLFEYWVGDDDLDEPFNSSVADSLRSLGDKGVAVSFMHGNRDFLIQNRFAARCGARLLADPELLEDLHGTRTLLMHGDTLCTDYLEYQKLRAYTHDPENQRRFLALPLPERHRQALGMRAESEKSKLDKSEEIMDVTPATVERALRAFGYPRLIHGHTHRPARHVHDVDGHACERWVLTDWYGRAGYLRCDAGGCTPVALPSPG